MIWFMVVVVAVLVAINLFVLRGQDLRVYDQPRPDVFGADQSPSQTHHEVVASLREMIAGSLESAPRSERRSMAARQAGAPARAA